MKPNIHPEMYDVVFVDSSSGAQFITTSTVKSEETVKIGGKEYFVIKVETTSDTHPFFTGKQRLLDTAGRVDKFRAKQKAAAKYDAENPAEVEEEAMVAEEA
ncbi:50S ribosomal protein L31 [Candidatus Peregrinibacteria bacterium CG11_big_fil_rev_8_21_14_0_20_41_10]|nr:MAG: 50S ribosomal protein L31 [Candidatus Peregrinibacteria bacterium CG11_big_fil_rev_8_21_14_0_20_41_10]PIZ73925.1 MAG: 50S ribosomal protein L31 [Candidatus Peregrinibacteria bacterium CG_4_10_14_0_2_um_filter_41_8]PJC37889.1 MAG: 50S ribosomal protein L31 [Candidatus Peregrinibacteria bacterium CG_4_9_14_0_2_um_filter_41_14]